VLELLSLLQLRRSDTPHSAPCCQNYDKNESNDVTNKWYLGAGPLTRTVEVYSFWTWALRKATLRFIPKDMGEGGPKLLTCGKDLVPRRNRNRAAQPVESCLAELPNHLHASLLHKSRVWLKKNLKHCYKNTWKFLLFPGRIFWTVKFWHMIWIDTCSFSLITSLYYKYVSIYPTTIRDEGKFPT